MVRIKKSSSTNNPEAPFSASKAYALRIADALGKTEVRIKEVDRICARKQRLCVSDTFYTGVVFFGIFVIAVFALNALHELLHVIFIQGYGITISGMTIGLLLSNVTVALPAGLPWWEYFIMVYGPLLIFSGILIVVMWAYPRADVAVYRGSSWGSWAKIKYGKMFLRGTGIYLSTSLLFNTVLSPVFNFVYQVFIPWYGKTDLGLLWDISLGMGGMDQFLLQTFVIVGTVAMAVVAFAYIFSNRVFGKERIDLG